jgi:hypothetical protein
MSTRMSTRTFESDCPECHEQCWWCSMYRWIVRSEGCMTAYPQRGKCKKGEAANGEACGTCDGSRRVVVEQTIRRREVTE